MVITLSKEDLNRNRSEIKQCVLGEMCKILQIDDVLTGKREYMIDTDVTSGWDFFLDKSFHGRTDNVTWKRSGLGVFLLVRKTDNADGGCTLEFTDDLNPDVP